VSRGRAVAGLAGALVAVGVGSSTAGATTLRVSAHANIFGSGHASLPPASNGTAGAGEKPPSASMAGHSRDAVAFSGVTGQLGCAGSNTNGPDGGTCAGGVTNINSLKGISGIVDINRTMFLVGVFVGGKEPADPPPERLDFSNAHLGMDFGSLSPKLDQTFFIGDGENAIGAKQQFLIPSGARRLYLGFADAFAFRGNPGTYQDNVGSVTARFSVGPFTPPPVAGKSVVADVVSGTVLIKLPSGKRIRRSARKSTFAHGAKFRRYRGRANIPVGSTLDTRKGRIAITSAADLKGATQSAQFYDGVFQIKQKRQADLITDAQLVTSRSACGKSSAEASRTRRLGRLWATGKGRFRTKGRYSAASVRGTTWLTEDRCDGTLTKVSRGTVSVFDAVTKQTIVVKSGQSYLARAQRASTKS
jgi:hypothetical protein